MFSAGPCDSPTDILIIANYLRIEYGTENSVIYFTGVNYAACGSERRCKRI